MRSSYISDVILFLFYIAYAQGTTLSCGSHNSFVYEIRGNATVRLTDDGQQKSPVELLGEVSITKQGYVTDIRVLSLTMTGPDGEKYTNPVGLDLPVLVNLQKEPGEQLSTEITDTHSSISVKKAIIELLPKRAFNQGQNDTNLSAIQATLDLLKKGDEKIILRDDYKNIILILGNTGAGKSTFTQWIAGDSSRLEAKEVVEGEYIIEDNLNRIGNSTIDSKTTFPELIIDEENSEAFYDFPGFSDTRNSTYDIAQSYFIKKTIDHADAVKLLFVISYPSVRKGVDRQDFLKLLTHATELIRDMDKFRNSISLIITKVDNQYVVKRNIPYLIDDNKVIGGIANFLKEAKTDLEHRLEDSHASVKEMHLYDSAIKFIDALLVTDGNRYTKIGIFRRPGDAGLLSDMPLLEDEKIGIKNMVAVTLTYTQKDIDDFGRTVSDKSKNDINDLVQEIDKSILVSTCTIAQELQEYFRKFINILNFNIKSININILTNADTDLIKINQLLNKFKNDSYIVENLVQKIRTYDNINDVSKLIHNTLNNLGNDNISSNTVSSMLTQGRYLEFLHEVAQDASNIRMSSLAWASSFQDVMSELVVAKNHIEEDIEDLENQLETKIKQEISNVGLGLKRHFNEMERNIVDLAQLYNAFTLKYNMLLSINDTDSDKYVHRIMNMVNGTNVSSADGLQAHIVKYSKYKNHLIETIGYVIKDVHHAVLWYDFLIKFYDKLSTYEIQSNVKKFDSIIKEIIQLDDNKHVRDTPLKSILEYFYDDNYQDLISISDVILDKFKIRNLESVISFTLQKTSQTCKPNGALVVNGPNVKLSDVLYMACPKPIKLIELFALNKVFFDKTFDKTGEDIQLAIMAPTWEVYGDPEIILDGLPAPDYNIKANDAIYDGESGDDGKPGLPGGTGGNFFGIGLNFINSGRLTVSAMGGKGGKGQDGGKGENGANGTAPNIVKPGKYLEDIGWYYNKTKYTCYTFYCEYDPIYNDNCTNGGDGGRGGFGGYGGNPGKIVIKSVSGPKPYIRQFNFPGELGSRGRSGSPGDSGHKGQYCKINWAPLRFWDITKKECFDLEECKSGSNYENSTNRNDMEQPKPTNELPALVIMNDYKTYLEEHASDTLMELKARDFLEKLLHIYN